MKISRASYLKPRPMRRASLIGPYGVGAIVPFPNDETLMISGLDMWRYNDKSAFIIRDERLCKRLNVSELRWPPDYRDPKSDPDNSRITIPSLRFPTWYYCPFCGEMSKTTYYSTDVPQCKAIQWTKGRKCSPSWRNRNMIPERFIIVCPEGHINDFPIAEWLHDGSGQKYDPEHCTIRRSTGGASASLSGIYYECTCGARKSLTGVLGKGYLARIGYKCKCGKPWLGMASDEKEVCNSKPEDLRVVLRGATNVWFPNTISSISIPKQEDKEAITIAKLVNEHIDIIKSQRDEKGDIPKDIIKALAVLKKVDEDKLYQAFEQRITGETEKTKYTVVSEDEYRLAEYQNLVLGAGNDNSDFYAVAKNITEYDPCIHELFDSISLVFKLRETRAFYGFSRLQPDDKTIAQKRAMLSRSKLNWLPAIEVYGEGIFLKFNEVNLLKWADRTDVKKRIDELDYNFHHSYMGQKISDDTHLNPIYVMIHTFAHLLINQLSFECGYGSSSLRERLYCQKTSNDLHMYGVLIYTASGDSEGSMGGLVRQGEAGRLENTILDTIKNSEWCSSDPICINSKGQGPESLNLAACLNCTLLPETCCENGNRLLDRGLIVGTLEDKKIGYFDSIRKF